MKKTKQNKTAKELSQLNVICIRIFKHEKKRHFSWTALSQVGAKQLTEITGDTENLHSDAILLVPVFPKVDRTLNIGLISIY